MIIPLRVTSDQEELGLDLSQHGEVMQDLTPAHALAGTPSEPRAARAPPSRVHVSDLRWDDDVATFDACS